MHEGLTLDSGAITGAILTGLLGAVAWIFRRNEGMAEKRIEKLETQQEKNIAKLTDISERVTAIESSYVKQSDMRDLVDALRDEMYADLDKSFTRIHERIDGFFHGATCEVPSAPKRKYPSEPPAIDYGKYDH